MKKLKKTIVICLVGLVLLVPTSLCFGCKKEGVNMPPLAAYAEQTSTCKNRVHFLNTKNSDCIILESDGHIAVVDCAEDSANPKGIQSTEEFEQTVIDYIKHYFADEQGKVHIDFILGTHAHSDHIGGFDTLISDEDITIDIAYLKRYYADRIRQFEVDNWDNDIVYNEMLAAIADREITLVQDLPTTQFSLGDFSVRFFNTAEPEIGKDLFENDNAVATLVTFGGKKILLMADVNNYNGDEDEIAAAVGKVDLLKVGHHGYDGSTTKAFLNAVKPSLSVLTNVYKWAKADVRNGLINSGSLLYSTVTENGIIAEIDENAIQLYKNAMVY